MGLSIVRGTPLAVLPNAADFWANRDAGHWPCLSWSLGQKVLNWYLVFTKPQRERAAVENLERQSYKVYLPLIRNRKRIGGRYLRIVEPMFPRYLFIQLDDERDDWGPIRSTVGVSHLVRFGLAPARLPATLVRLMRAREDSTGIQSLPTEELKAGDPVRILEGVMAGYEAIYQSRSGNERVNVLLEIAEKCVQVTLKQDDVEAVSADSSFGRRR